MRSGREECVGGGRGILGELECVCVGGESV